MTRKVEGGVRWGRTGLAAGTETSAVLIQMKNKDFTPNKKYIQHGDEGYGLIGKPEEATKLPE